MNIDQLKQAIYAAAVSRNIIEEGAPLGDEELLAAVKVLGMGPKAAQPSQEPELESMTRMFHSACADLGLINEALGLDPDDGGAEPILDAIEELKKRAAQPVAQNMDCSTSTEMQPREVLIDRLHSLQEVLDSERAVYADLEAKCKAQAERHVLTDAELTAKLSEGIDCWTEIEPEDRGDILTTVKSILSTAPQVEQVEAKEG